MNEYLLEDLLEEAYKLDFAEFDNPPKHRFSLRHRMRMRKIFSRFKKNARHYSIPVHKVGKNMLRWAVMIIILAALTITAAAVTLSFLRREHEDNTELFAANIEGAPEVLEEIYVLTALPEEYECTSDNLMDILHGCGFTNKITGQTVSFHQFVKSYFDVHYNTEENNFENISINNYEGLYIDFEYDGVESGLLVWDNGDYIFELTGDFSKKELIHLAETVKIQ
ncbi:MAG: DUF4367 domain-containing protein [Eubacterium sp.]|nr:DUF4367 domain-containing protein [Eubacterium sp.]